MTVKELKDKIEHLPDYMDVFVAQTNDEYFNSLLERAEVREIEFKDGTLRAVDNCLVLTDQI